jgi:hypothetical protein
MPELLSFKPNVNNIYKYLVKIIYDNILVYILNPYIPGALVYKYWPVPYHAYIYTYR